MTRLNRQTHAPGADLDREVSATMKEWCSAGAHEARWLGRLDIVDVEFGRIADKMLSAMRKGFSGHQEAKKT